MLNRETSDLIHSNITRRICIWWSIRNRLLILAWGILTLSIILLRSSHSITRQRDIGIDKSIYHLLTISIIAFLISYCMTFQKFLHGINKYREYRDDSVATFIFDIRSCCHDDDVSDPIIHPASCADEETEGRYLWKSTSCCHADGWLLTFSIWLVALAQLISLLTLQTVLFPDSKGF